MKTTSNEGYKTLRDLATILSLFNSYQIEDRSVSEISKALDMFPSKISRMLGTLEKEGFFEKNPENGKYRLGIRFFELGMIYTSNFPFRKVIRPHLEQMARELNLTSSWAILGKNKIIVVDRIQNLTIDLVTHIMGVNSPVYCTSVGKILLAYLPKNEQEEILDSVDLNKFTKNTVVDRKLIMENLKLVRENGYATDQEEMFEDLNCIAAPIRNNTGRVIAAINLMDTKTRTNPEKLFNYAAYLKEKALFISRQIGYRSNILD
jgi:IclR family transcriptional regulator, KDG regulon repressor